MRKFLLIFGILIIGVVAASMVIWSNRANIAAHYISKHLHVPVTLQTLEVSKTYAYLNRLWIGNPPQSKTKTAFSSEIIDIEANLDEVLGDPLIINEINIENIYVGIENYNSSGTETNWTYILKSDTPRKKSKDYLIRRLVLQNITVELTQANGQVKRYPTIARMEFRNISSDSGFPIEEIEKAIFNLMMQDLFKKLNLDQLLKSLPGNNPIKYLPNLFGS